MKLVPMRYKGFEWQHNPREIKFECEKAVKEFLSPEQTSYVQNLGRKNRLISGTGELYGADCLEKFHKLWLLFESGGSGILSIPNTEPVYATFESLTLLGKPQPDLLTYSFVFRENMERKKQNTSSRHTASYGETLWDISYKYEASIDELVRLNPSVKRPDELLEGQVILLADV